MPSSTQKAPLGSASRQITSAEVIISKVFHHSFDLVTEVVAVLCGSPRRAQSIVAQNLVGMATHRLTDDPARNLARLRAKSLETLKAEWIPTPTSNSMRHSPLALIQSLPFGEAAAYVLDSFAGLDPVDISVALGSTEAGAKAELKRATFAIKSRIKQEPEDLVSVFNSEAEFMASQEYAEPKILEQILADIAAQTPQTVRRPTGASKRRKPLLRRLRA